MKYCDIIYNMLRPQFFRKSAYILFLYLYMVGFTTVVEADENATNISNDGEIIYPGPPVASLSLKRYTTNVKPTSRSSITTDMLAFDLGLDMVCCMRGFSPQVKELKQKNPNITVLLYENVRDVWKGSEDWDTILDNGWLAKSSDGHYLVYPPWYKDFCIDIGHPDYQDFLIDFVATKIEQYGYDGIYWDWGLNPSANAMFGQLIKEGTDNEPGYPWNPRTRQPYTDKDHDDALIAIHTKTRQKLGSDKLITVNGLWTGSRWFSQKEGFERILSHTDIDGIAIEGVFYRYGGRWISEKQWIDGVECLEWFEDHWLNNRRFMMPQVKCTQNSGLPSDCSLRQMATYGFASCLMGINSSRNYLELHRSASLSMTSEIDEIAMELHSIETGRPLGRYSIVSGTHVYTREFTRVTVYVNPSNMQYHVDGMILSPHTGVIVQE
jgi:hypothetical protein